MSTVLDHDLAPDLAKLRDIRGSSALAASPDFRRIEPAVRRILSAVATYDHGGRPPEATNRPYRAVAWNIERGLRLDAVIDALTHHADLRDADIYLLTELDYGMARTANRDVPGEIARRLGLNGVFVPAYLNLDKGSGIENSVVDSNRYGLHGNGLFSRWPIRDETTVPLTNGKDKMAGPERRIGQQKAVVATVDLPAGPLRCASIHLDAHSSQAHRRRQLHEIIQVVESSPVASALIGGDWNTCTHNTSRAAWAIAGFWLRVLMGARHCLRRHYPHPERLFERRLFAMLERRGWEYRDFNQLGACTVRHIIHDPALRRNLLDWLPEWCIRRIDWALAPFGGAFGLKLDWFAGRGIRPNGRDGVSPSTVVQVPHDSAGRLSDHDPIVVHFSLAC